MRPLVPIALLLLTLTGGVVACGGETAPVAAPEAPPTVDDTVHTEPGTYLVSVGGMSCSRCAETVQSRFERRLEGVTSVSVDAETGLATIVLGEGGSLSVSRCAKALEGMHYPVTAVAKDGP
ncbi:MAG: heavy metal-associated domain-containing protein [Planctomycetota bacterium]